MNDYFSDREKGAIPREIYDLSFRVWDGIYELIDSKIRDGSFGHSFPEVCLDGGAIYGTNKRKFEKAAMAEIPTINIEECHKEIPDIFAKLDLIEFCFKNIAKPRSAYHHDYYKHFHYEYDVESGQEEFRNDINTIFARNGIGLS